MGEKGAATRARILEASRVEFAEFGFAGARVDRIAERAQADKAQLYSHFGNKDPLFDAVLHDSFEAIVDAVSVDLTDLPGYAVRLHDHDLEEPWVIRLATWARLERRPSGLVVPSLSPPQVFTAVIALSMTWSPASTTFAAAADDPPAEHDRRRGVLRTLVARAFGTTSPSRP